MLSNTLKLIYKTLKPNVSTATRSICISSIAHAQVENNDKEENIYEENWKLRCELATAYRAFEKYNMHEGVCNHLSVKAPSLYHKEDIALIIPYGMYWGSVTPDNLIGIDIDTGKTVEGRGEPELTARSIHGGLYRNRNDIKSIMHAHPKYSTILSVMKDPTIKLIHQNSARFMKNVAYDQNYEAIASEGKNEEGDRLGKAIGDKEILVMGNHGLTTVGENVAQAFDAMYYFEKAAQVQILAYQTGKPLLNLSEEIAEEMCNVLNDRTTQTMYAKAHLEGLLEFFKNTDTRFRKH